MSGDDLGRKLDVLHASFGEHGVPRAVEDLPPDSRDKLPGLASAPEKHPLWQRILDELADVGLDSYGDLEIVPLLHFLSQYPVTAYTYPVSPELSRGERPSLAKLRDLAGQGYQRTVNLCAETVGGDTPLITMAGLAGPLDTVHLPIVDMHNPTPAQVVQLLDLLTAPGAPRTYLHCEAGRCRTGVMVACYRMAVMGWDETDAHRGRELRLLGAAAAGVHPGVRGPAGRPRRRSRPAPARLLGRAGPVSAETAGLGPAHPGRTRATLGAVARTEQGGIE